MSQLLDSHQPGLFPMGPKTITDAQHQVVGILETIKTITDVKENLRRKSGF